MTPKEILQKAFEEKISRQLEQLGFGYVRSKFAYKRTVGVFTQQISVTLSHRNTGESIIFWSAFNVTSLEYNKWRQLQGVDKCEGYLGGGMDWNIPGWRLTEDASSSFDFSLIEHRNDVLNDWLSRCLSIGIPYLDSLSSWEALAYDLVRSRWHWDRACDFFLIAGNFDKAIDALEAGIQFLLGQDYSFSENAHPSLVWKKRRQAEERNQEVQAFRDRILEITSREK